MIYSDIGSFDLENCRISDVHRSDNEITIALKSTHFISKKDPADETLNAVIRLSNVIRESAIQYLEGGEEKPVELSGCPLDIVELASLENGTLNLQGYKNNAPWFCWEISALNITVEWGENRATAT